MTKKKTWHKNGGWPSVFIGKNRQHRIGGIMTDRGKRCYERARRRLAKMAGIDDPTKVSDADTSEYLARGEKETRKYIATHQR